jgi:hypothetical protein
MKSAKSGVFPAATLIAEARRQLRGFDPVPLLYLSLIVLGVVWLIDALFGRDALIALSIIYGVTAVCSLIAKRL